jgi:glycosyltransferase involved in cell wall biosynthesis
MSSVDVIVPCYKYAHYLRQCVESVLGQSHGDLRVLIIDDASPDNTEEVARELVARDHRVAYRRHEVNRGHIATYNEGLDWADGDYVLVLSADDLLTPGALGRAVELLDVHPLVGFAYGCQIPFHADRPLPAPRPEGETAWQVVEGCEFLGCCCAVAHNPVATPTAVVRTAIQRQVGGYRHDLPHTADLELWLRLAARGSVGWLDADQAYKRVHANNMQYQYRLALDDLRHRRAAFEAFFAWAGDRLADRGSLEQLAARGLAGMGFWAASAAFDEGDLAGCQQLVDFALALDPELPSQPRWARFALKRSLGPRAWRVVRPLADLLRAPFRSAKTVPA